jgi:CBS domain-containing protein
MKVRSILEQKGTRIVTVRLNETIATAVRLLKHDDIGVLVVKDVCRTEGNTVVGMLSERDIVRAFADHGAATLSMAVSEFTTGQVIHCTEDDDLDGVIRLMAEHGVRHLPVLDSGRMVGLISVTDVLRFAGGGRDAPGRGVEGAPAAVSAG